MTELKGSNAGERKVKCSASHVRAVGLRGRRRRRQGQGALRSRCWEQRDPGLRFRPRWVTAIHMRSAVALRSMMKYRLTGSDQPLNGLNLIGKAALNVLEPRSGREIIAVEEKRSHVSHEHMSFKQGVVRLCQLGIGK